MPELRLPLKRDRDLLLLIGRYSLAPLTEAGTDSQQPYGLGKLLPAEVGDITLFDRNTWPVAFIASCA